MSEVQSVAGHLSFMRTVLLSQHRMWNGWVNSPWYFLNYVSHTSKGLVNMATYCASYHWYFSLKITGSPHCSEKNVVNLAKRQCSLSKREKKTGQKIHYCIRRNNKLDWIGWDFAKTNGHSTKLFWHWTVFSYVCFILFCIVKSNWSRLLFWIITHTQSSWTQNQVKG